MRSNHTSHLKRSGIKRIIQETADTRKAKSIRVSPLESRLNTGCMNSPKSSLSPKRKSKYLGTSISRYVTKAFASPALLCKKRNITSALSQKRSTPPSTSANKQGSKKIPFNSHDLKISEFNPGDKQSKREHEHERSFGSEVSRNKFYLSSDSEEAIRDKLITSIQDSFKSTGVGPVTSPEFYKISRQIGNGAFGKVSLACNRLTGLKVAIKTIEKAFIKDQRTRRKIFQEVFIMKKLQHKHIIRLLEVFESSRNVMIVLEYAGGGDLLQIIKSRGRLTEQEGRGIFFQVIDAVQACHSAGVVHRDIKLDNILLNSDATEIKLCDFGVSRFCKAGERVNEQCGTPAYLAPEIIADEGYEPFYVDIWSMGVLLYAMLSANVPFKAKNLPDLHKLILKGRYDVPDHLSEDAADLISKMLNPVPHFRISLSEMKKHRWFDGYVEEPVSDNGYNIKRQNIILNRMVSFGFPRDYVMQSLNLKDVNHATATYNLLDISEEL